MLVQETEIKDVNVATSFFINFMAVKKEIYNLYLAGEVSPVYKDIHDNTEFYERDIDPDEDINDFNVPVKQQDKSKWRSKKPVARLVRRDQISPFGFKDSSYHYIIFRKKLLGRWADSLHIDKYRSQPGIYLPMSILDHMFKNDIIEISKLILVTIDKKIYEISCKDLMNYFKKLKNGIFINQWAVEMTGIPLSMFKEITT